MFRPDRAAVREAIVTTAGTPEARSIDALEQPARVEQFHRAVIDRPRCLRGGL